jgi:PAS domain S-box-containing protein
MRKSKSVAALDAVKVGQADQYPVPPEMKKPSSDHDHRQDTSLSTPAERSFGLLLCNSALRILEADVAACELFGCARPRDLIQRNLLDLLVANDRQRASSAIQGLFEGRAEAVEDELRALRENGHPRWLGAQRHGCAFESLIGTRPMIASSPWQIVKGCSAKP